MRPLVLAHAVLLLLLLTGCSAHGAAQDVDIDIPEIDVPDGVDLPTIDTTPQSITGTVDWSTYTPTMTVTWTSTGVPALQPAVSVYYESPYGGIDSDHCTSPCTVPMTTWKGMSYRDRVLVKGLTVQVISGNKEAEAAVAFDPPEQLDPAPMDLAVSFDLTPSVPVATLTWNTNTPVGTMHAAYINYPLGSDSTLDRNDACTSPCTIYLTHYLTLTTAQKTFISQNEVTVVVVTSGGGDARLNAKLNAPQGSSVQQPAPAPPVTQPQPEQAPPTSAPPSDASGSTTWTASPSGAPPADAASDPDSPTGVAPPAEAPTNDGLPTLAIVMIVIGAAAVTGAVVVVLMRRRAA